jgi:hypothetical protein
LYYRDKRDIYSFEWAKHIPNLKICNDWFEQDDVILVPWLVGDDHKKIKTASAKYMFGHFELPHFKMNAMVEMPDHGEIKSEHFQQYGDSVFWTFSFATTEKQHQLYWQCISAQL